MTQRRRARIAPVHTPHGPMWDAFDITKYLGTRCSRSVPALERTPWQTPRGERVYTARQWLSEIGREGGMRVTLSLGQHAAWVGEDMKVSPVVKGSRNL